MKFVKFVDNRFQEIRADQVVDEKKAEYSIARDSETLALQTLLTFLRWTLKWVYVPKVLFDYFLVELDLKKEPQAVLLNRIKADVEKEKQAKAATLAANANVSPIKPA